MRFRHSRGGPNSWAFDRHDKYSLMQSDGNSFCGDVVLDSFNKAYRDKDTILDQKYEKRIFFYLYYEDFIFKVD